MKKIATLKPRITPIEITAPQRSEDWYRARLGSVTGSESKKAFYNISDTAKASVIRDILQVKALTKGIKEKPEFLDLWNKDPIALFDEQQLRIPEPKDRQKYRQEIVAERLTGLGADADKYISNDMKWGMVNEKLAIAKYQLITKNIVKDANFLLHPEIRAGASPDGMVIDRLTGLLGVIECKCLRTNNHLYDIIKANKIPEEYMVQIHMEIWISGRDFCDFIGYDSRLQEGIDIFIKRVERDDNYINNILEPTIIRFLDDCKRDENYFRMKIREKRNAKK